jgi:hypothetical protein
MLRTMEAAMSDDLALTPSTPSRSVIPTDLNALLPRDATATALTEAGYPISKATLATMASRGGGPPYQMWGPRVIYRWGTSLAWAQARLSAPVRSTSELDPPASPNPAT